MAAENGIEEADETSGPDEIQVRPENEARYTWNAHDAEHLHPTEHWWVGRQKWLLESHGYQLRPRYRQGWVPSWKDTGKFPLTCEDGYSMPAWRSHMMDAIRISDNEIVMLKRIIKNENSSEVEIGKFFTEDPLARSDPKNHCVPLLDVLEVPDEKDMQILVMPFLRPFNNPKFMTVGEGVDFFRQIFEGIQFMHSHHIAHRDCSSDNIMMDAKSLYPDGFHPLLLKRKRDYTGKARHYNRTEHPPKHYLVDFSLSRRYDPRDGPAKDYPVFGADRSVPEFQDKKYNELIDPFATDIYYLGNLIQSEFTSSRYGFEFMEPLVHEMTLEDPSKRPTIDQVITDFKEIYDYLPPSRLRARGAHRHEVELSAMWNGITHFFRRIRYTIQGVPPVPEKDNPFYQRPKRISSITDSTTSTASTESQPPEPVQNEPEAFPTSFLDQPTTYPSQPNGYPNGQGRYPDAQSTLNGRAAKNPSSDRPRRSHSRQGSQMESRSVRHRDIEPPAENLEGRSSRQGGYPRSSLAGSRRAQLDQSTSSLENIPDENDRHRSSSRTSQNPNGAPRKVRIDHVATTTESRRNSASQGRPESRSRPKVEPSTYRKEDDTKSHRRSSRTHTNGHPPSEAPRSNEPNRKGPKEPEAQPEQKPPGKWDCLLCGKTMSTKADFLDHTQRRHPNYHLCLDCGSYYTKEENLTKHQEKRGHGGRAPPNE